MRQVFTMMAIGFGAPMALFIQWMTMQRLLFIALIAAVPALVIATALGWSFKRGFDKREDPSFIPHEATMPRHWQAIVFVAVLLTLPFLGWIVNAVPMQQMIAGLMGFNVWFFVFLLAACVFFERREGIRVHAWLDGYHIEDKS